MVDDDASTSGDPEQDPQFKNAGSSQSGGALSNVDDTISRLQPASPHGNLQSGETPSSSGTHETGMFIEKSKLAIPAETEESAGDASLPPASPLEYENVLSGGALPEATPVAPTGRDESPASPPEYENVLSGDALPEATPVAPTGRDESPPEYENIFSGGALPEATPVAPTGRDELPASPLENENVFSGGAATPVALTGRDEERFPDKLVEERIEIPTGESSEPETAELDSRSEPDVTSEQWNVSAEEGTEYSSAVSRAFFSEDKEASPTDTPGLISEEDNGSDEEPLREHTRRATFEAEFLVVQDGSEEEVPEADYRSCIEERDLSDEEPLPRLLSQKRKLSVRIPDDFYQEKVPGADMGLHSPQPEIKRFSRIRDESDEDDEECEAENAFRRASHRRGVRFSIDARSADRKKVRFLLPLANGAEKVYYPGKIRSRRKTIVTSSVQVYPEPPLMLVFHLIDAQRFMHLTGKKRAAVCHGLAWVVTALAVVAFIICFSMFITYLHLKPTPPLVRIARVDFSFLQVLPLSPADIVKMENEGQYFHYNFTFAATYYVDYKNSNSKLAIYNEQMTAKILCFGYLITTNTFQDFKIPRSETVQLQVQVMRIMKLPLLIGDAISREFARMKFRFTGDFMIRARASTAGLFKSTRFVIRILCYVLLTNRGIERQDCRNI